MATAKIATLAIRTLAKPIATQLKSQAAQHETFRKMCIALAQQMHRTEMALRANLLPNGMPQKVRPLNDAKAIANGANAISEGFLFFVAAALIVGETYRGSRKKAEQRDRTEDSVNHLKQQIDKLALAVGVSLDSLEPASADGDGNAATEDTDASSTEARVCILETKQEELRSRRLEAAVSVLLQLALRNRWVAGQDAAELAALINGDDMPQHGEAGAADEPSRSPPLTPGSADAGRGTTSAPAQLSIVHQVALERAQALAREIRSDPRQAGAPSTASEPRTFTQEPSLADLLAQHTQHSAPPP